MNDPSLHTAAIEVTGLRRRYGEVVALAGVDLEVAPGECVALLGPNGAGKTTTIEILEGHRRRDGGTVRVLGIDPVDAPRAWRARIGIVLQQVWDQQELTVAEVVRHFAGYYPAPRDPAELIAAVGLGDKRDSRVISLSGGQRRRLDVALGLVGDPELLFLDEPTTGFDPEARREFWRLILSLKEAGTTILLTTHYLDEAEQLADRVLVIAAGRVLAEGAPDELRRRALPIVSWTEPDGGVRSVPTGQPTELLRQLTARFPSGEIPGIAVRQPSLEDVYLDLIAQPEAA
jgi:ABC-2 type transport system ATP-binding protein